MRREVRVPDSACGDSLDSACGDSLVHKGVAWLCSSPWTRRVTVNAPRTPSRRHNAKGRICIPDLHHQLHCCEKYWC
ncbi:hypothetical protein E2C01_093124 [Portunus trituberculatus]|uniref:Uncharacterized protein n=1 Tax=Portunus trituberculatus TaxID=210409 RepID=A0A5B7JNZ7_PORTR|nr:hypothetical protein [Portunus trituberculatus]